MKRNSQSGVALVITLLLLAVITVMAVTFLVVTQNERQRTDVQSNQSDATFAANDAAEQAKATILALMTSRTNGFDFGPLVATNYQSRYFDNTPGPGLSRITNVSYFYANGTPVVGQDLFQSLNNLQYLARAPVFVVTNAVTGAQEFRYYLDLNRNGRFDTNGPGPWLDALGNVIEANHPFLGDPEWIAVFDKPEQRHSATNKAVSRFTYVVLPIGNSLDINYNHNSAKLINAKADGYFRNQGVGTWEINLAAFLYYLNTNNYAWGGLYDYETDLGKQSSGFAFDDAINLIAFRYKGSFNNLLTANAYFGNAAPFAFDSIDHYTHGPLWVTDTPLNILPNPSLLNKPWPGSDNPQHLFTSQDPFTALFSPSTFSNRLYSVGRLNNPYDQYTYYRMLSQLSFESAPEGTNKINLNYVNNPGGAAATSFIPWSPVQFFTATAEKLLEDLTNSVSSTYLVAYPTNFSINNIQIYPTNFYSTAVHRALQLAANMYDATTSREFTAGSGYPYYPSVFRPVFNTTGSGSNQVIYINGYVEETTAPNLAQPLALPEQASLVTPGNIPVNIYGVPWVIGAKKGFPNFNEFSMQNFSQITRKLQINKVYAGSPRNQWQTNQMFVIGISNVLGVEAWNSYYTNYTRQVSIIASNDLVMTLTMTNDAGTQLYSTILSQPSSAAYATNNWPGFRNTGGAADKASFQIPINTGTIFVPDSFYRSTNPRGLYATAIGVNDVFEHTTDFRAPHFVLGVTNRLRFMMVDTATGRLLDYASFNAITNVMDLTAQLPQNDPSGPNQYLSFWDTNLLSTASNNPAAPPLGLINQITGSLIQNGNGSIQLKDWNNAQVGAAVDQTSRSNAIADFIAFYNNQITNLVKQVPFTPTRKFSDYWSWQANDPLVHYTLSDLANYPQTNKFTLVVPPNNPPTSQVLANLGKVNDRYRPWGGNPKTPDPATDYNLALKDPLVRNSDGWQFPTNKFPNIGWLGRVHRGTPWQTVYLKSTPVPSAAWAAWTGNAEFLSAQMNQPTNDWRLLDFFTTAPNANATRGQLSVNQTNLSSWAAALMGVIVLSNSTADYDLQNGVPATFTPLAIDPATNEAGFFRMVTAINETRRTNSPSAGRVFQHVGDILAVPELTVNSPYLNTSSSQQLQGGISDAEYERIPQQIMSLLKVGEPRFVIFAYGQSLKPADHSLVQSSGPYFGMCTNYQITGEVVTRTVIRVVNPPVPRFQNGIPRSPPLPPQIIVESFNVLGPE